MKPQKLLLVFILIFTCVVFVTSCDTFASIGIGKHVHEYGSEWIHDETSHWKICTKKGCDETTVKADHTWSDPAITKLESGAENHVYTCTVCGASKIETIEPPEHIHSTNEKWTSDIVVHWNTCEGCDEHLNEAAHTWDAGTVIIVAIPGHTGTLRYLCTVCNASKYEDIPALPTKMSEEEWISHFKFISVRVDAVFTTAETKTEYTMLFDREYVEITAPDGEAHFMKSSSERQYLDFSSQYGYFKFMGNDTYYGDMVPLRINGSTELLYNVTIIFKDGQISSLSYTYDYSEAIFTYTFSQWDEITLSYPALTEEYYRAALEPRNFQRYTLNVERYSSSYGFTAYTYVFNGEQYDYTYYISVDYTTHQQGRLENAGIVKNNVYNALTELDASDYRYDIDTGEFVVYNPRIISDDLSYFSIIFYKGLLSEVRTIYDDGAVGTYYFSDWGVLTDPVLTKEAYDKMLNDENFRNYNCHINTFAENPDFYTYIYLFDGDYYIEMYSDETTSYTKNGMTENAGVVLNPALQMLKELRAEDFIYDPYHEAFVLLPNKLSELMLDEFILRINDGYITDVIISYSSGEIEYRDIEFYYIH